MQNLSLVWKSTLAQEINDSYYGQYTVYSDVASQQFYQNIRVPGYGGPFPKTKGVPLPINPFAYGKYRTQSSVSRQSVSLGKVTYRSVGPNGSIDNPYIWVQLPSDADLQNRLIEKLNEQTRGNLNLAVDLAEASQTSGMVTGGVKGLLRGVPSQMIRNLARLEAWGGEVSRAGRRQGITRFMLPRAAGGAWLTYNLGIRPLLGTIYGLAELTLRTAINRTRMHRVTVSETVAPDELMWATFTGQVQVSDPSTFKVFKRTMRYGIEMYEPNGYSINDFTSLNPALIAWEMMPLSFVVDWVYDLGGWMEAWETSLSLNRMFLRGYRSLTTTASGEYVKRILGSQTWSGHYKLAIRDYRDYSRVVLNGYPSPRPPTLGVNLGSSRLLTSASLLATLGLGRKR